MIFGNEKVFYLLSVLIAAVVLFVRDEKVRSRFLALWTSPKDADRLTGSISKSRRGIRKCMEILSFALIICALAHPLAGLKKEEVKRKGVDVVIALDVSSSMLAEDYAPNRLQKAKQELKGLLGHVEGHRIGLLAFAGYAAVLCPITTDTSTLQTYLDVLDTQLFNLQGTALSDAIQKAVSMFNQKAPHGKALVLITDGENHEDSPLKAAREAAHAGVHIYCIGVGSSTGEPIPIFNKSGEKAGHKTDSKGDVVLSKLDESTLSQIAASTGGKYFRASVNEMEIEEIFKEISRLEKGEFQAQDIFRYDETYQIPLFCAFLLLLWAEALGAKRGLINKLFLSFSKGIHLKSVKNMLIIIVVFTQFGFTKSGDIEDANKAYSDKKYDEAAQKYLQFLATHPENSEILFNLANTLYQKKDYAGAEKNYAESQKNQKPYLISQNKYGLGNVYFRKNHFEKALSFYKEAIELDPKDMDAKYNYEICLQKIKSEKEKKQKEQQQNQQDRNQPDQQKNKDQKQEDKKNKDQKQENQPEKKEEKNQKEQSSQDQEQKKKKQKEKESEKGQSQTNQQQKQQEQEKKSANKASPQKEKAQVSSQKNLSDKKEGNQLTRNEAFELLEAGHNDKKDLLYNLLRSQQQQDAPKKGKDW